jgi:transposase
MHTAQLIDNIVRQTTVLIAQLATSAGLRAPLAHVADQVFLELSSEIEAQGVSRKVVADMFGMALRGYQRKVQRLRESASVHGRTLWEAVLDHLQRHGSATQAELVARFEADGEEHLRAVLRDLQRSGLVYATGRGNSTVYGMSSTQDQQRMHRQDDEERLRPAVWYEVYRRSQPVQAVADKLGAELAAVLRAVDALRAEGLLTVEPDGAPAAHSLLASQRMLIPVGAERGWEIAVLDHFRAVANAIASKLRSDGPRSQANDVVGGATLVFDLSPAHPMLDEVKGQLGRVRRELNEIWQRHSAHNRAHPIPDDERIRVTFYFGQNLETAQETSE